MFLSEDGTWGEVKMVLRIAQKKILIMMEEISLNLKKWLTKRSTGISHGRYKFEF